MINTIIFLFSYYWALHVKIKLSKSSEITLYGNFDNEKYFVVMKEQLLRYKNQQRNHFIDTVNKYFKSSKHVNFKT